MTAASRSSSRSASERVSLGRARRASRRWAAFSLTCAALLVAPRASRAEDGNEKVTCIAKHEEAQVARRQGRFMDARAALLTCSSAMCPEMIRIDCGEWLMALNKSMPSVVFSARSKDGDKAAVRVLMDGHLVTTLIDGKAIDVNPGVHVLRFELPPHEPIERKVIIVEGDQNRVISVFFGLRGEDAPPPSLAPAGPRGARAAEERRPVPLTVFVLGGATLIGGGVFAGLAASGLADRRSLLTSCAPFCEESQVQPVRTKFLIADISLGVALGAAVSAGVLFLTRPRAPSKAIPASRSTSLWVAPGARGTLMGVGGAF